METKFIADAMLGKLARWMRVLGCDVEYFPSIGDRELVELAARSGRLILTRDTLLVRRRGRVTTISLWRETISGTSSGRLSSALPSIRPPAPSLVALNATLCLRRSGKAMSGRKFRLIYMRLRRSFASAPSVPESTGGGHIGMGL